MFRAALLCTLAVWACVSSALAVVVEEITFQGLEHYSRDDLLPLLPIEEGQPLELLESGELTKKLNRALRLKGLLVMGVLDEAGATTDGVRLIIVVRGASFLDSIKITGNDKLTTKTIKSVIPVKIDEPLPFDAAALIQREIIALYRKEGFQETGVIVETQEVTGEPGRKRVIVRIREGAKIKIKKLVIHGANWFDSKLLKMRCRSKGFFLGFKNYFNEEDFQDDLRELEAYYRSRGYLDAKVSAGRHEYGPDNAWIKPVIQITEGPVFKVGEVRLQGYRIFGRAEIEPIFAALKGKPFKNYERALGRLERLYGDNGYIAATFETDRDLDYTNATVDLTIRIAESVRIRVRDYVLERDAEHFGPDPDAGWFGKLMEWIAPQIDEDSIKKELRLKENDVYRTFQQIQSERNLRQLGIFDAVRVEPLATDEPDERDVRVYFKESGAGSFVRAGVMYNEEAGVVFFGGYTERNLGGEARHVDLDFTLGERYYSGDFTYVNRHSQFLRWIHRREEAEYRFRAYYYQVSRHNREYRERHAGASVTFGLEQDEFITDHIRFRLEHVDLNRRDGDDERDREWAYDSLNNRWVWRNVGDDDDDGVISDDFDTDYIVATVRRSRDWDSTDDEFFPTEGRQYGAGLELGAADGFLAKLTGHARGYWKLSPNTVYAASLSGGLMPYDADKVGVTERFFLGGDYDMRGFDSRGAGPKDPDDDDVARGGATKVLLQNELRYRIHENFTTHFFLDAGSIGAEAFSLDDLRMSAGAGVRVRVPWPRMYLTLEFAEAFVSESEDTDRFVHFRLGSRP